MFSYIAFLHSGFDHGSEKPIEDGKALAKQCLVRLDEIDNQEQFPPKLLVLLVSARYLDNGTNLDEGRAMQLIAGIHQAFSEAGHDNIPLIGSSVAAVFYDDGIYPGGALLACLASRLLDVKVAVGPNVSFSAEDAVKTLLKGLDIEHSLVDYPRALPNRALLTFFPGSDSNPAARHSTDKLHELLWRKLSYRIPVMGGVSSADDPARSKRGLQFVNRRSFTDSLAGCLVLSGLPLGTSLAKGLESTGTILHVEKLSADGKVIERLYEGSPEEIFKDETRPVLLRDLETDVVRAKCVPESGYRIVNLLREVRQHAALEVTTPTPQRIYEETKNAHRLSLQRAKIQSPVGCLSFKCADHFPYREVLGLDLENGIRAMRKQFGIPSYIGGFFDGEVGTDDAGSSVCGDWSTAAIIFGDEISERTAVQSGFASLAKHGVKLAEASRLEEDLEQSVGLIYDLGFPGAMISILMPDQDGRRFVPVKAKGSRFEKLLDRIRTNPEGDSLRYAVQHDRRPYFISAQQMGSDEPDDTACSRIASQYVLPLLDPEGTVFAMLRVDLGDTKGRTSIAPELARILEPIAGTVGATVNRIFSWEENRIVRELDNTLNRSLLERNLEEALQGFIEGALKAFSLRMGHVRLFEGEENNLSLKAGVGSYYEAARVSRATLDIGDWSLSCKAFSEDKITIINEPKNSVAYLVSQRTHSGTEAVDEGLKQVGSYANVPFRSEQGGKMGTISLVSDQPWFFIAYHERALAALRRRAGYLVDHFIRKESEAKAHRQSEELGRRLKFLQDVSPKLHLLSDFNDFHSLADVTQNFAEAMRAECASLVVWDENHEQYILRAAYGWRDPHWIDAARYQRDSHWIGNLPVTRPSYVPDLYHYYRTRRYSEPEGRYALQMFGQGLSETFSAEAWAIPLLVSGERLGALIVYRPVNPKSAPESKTGGFAINDIGLLQEGANQIAGLVKLLLSRQTIAFDQIAQRRLKEIYTVLSLSYDGIAFETAVCEKVSRALNASQVHFYSVNPNLVKSISWVYGCQTSRSGFLATNTSQPIDLEIERTALRNELKTFPLGVNSMPMQDPKLASMEGLLERACVPLRAAGVVVGVLDVRWEVDQADDSLVGNRGRQRLAELGQMIGSSYWRRQLTIEQKRVKEESEQSRQAVQAVGAMVLQTAHRFSNLVQTIYSLSQRLRDEGTEQERLECLDRLSEVIKKAMTTINWPMDTAQQLQQMTRERHQLGKLVAQAMADAGVTWPLSSGPDSIQEDMVVMVNPEHTKQALFNLMDNARRAVLETNGDLRISASKIPGTDKVRLEIEDTGVGMTNEEIENAMRGFALREGRAGVGVLISSVLLHLQGGSLAFKSTKGVGTTAIVTLPMAD